MTIEVPEEPLSSLGGGAAHPAAGSARAILRILQEPPYPSSEDVDALDAAIAAGRLPIRVRSPFSG